MFGISLHLFNVTFACVLLHFFRRQTYLSPPSAISARPVGQDVGFLDFRKLSLLGIHPSFLLIGLDGVLVVPLVDYLFVSGDKLGCRGFHPSGYIREPVPLDGMVLRQSSKPVCTCLHLFPFLADLMLLENAPGVISKRDSGAASQFACLFSALQFVEDDVGTLGGCGDEVPYSGGVLSGDGICEPVLPVLDLLIDAFMQLVLECFPDLILLWWLFFAVLRIDVLILLLELLQLPLLILLHLILKKISKVCGLD